MIKIEKRKMMRKSGVKRRESQFKNQQSKSAFIVFCLLFAVFYGCAVSNTSRKEDADIHYRVGIVHLNEGNIPEALKELTTAVEIYRNDAAFHNALGLAYFAKGMNEDAIKHLKEAVKINPKFSDAHTNLSAVYLEKKEWDVAVEEAKFALADIFYTTPEFAWFNMGRAYYEKADYIKAEESYKKTIESNPRYLVAYNNLGLTYMKMNKDKEAADVLGLAIKNMPNYADAQYNLGLALIKLKDKKGALNAFQEVIKLVPDSDMARSSKGYIELLK